MQRQSTTRRKLKIEARAHAADATRTHLDPCEATLVVKLVDLLVDVGVVRDALAEVLDRSGGVHALVVGRAELVCADVPT